MQQKRIRSFELQHESITLLGELGSGEFGMVRKGKWESSPQGPLQVAVKSLHRQEEESRYKLLKEAAIMGQFNHPYVVKLYGVIDQPNKVNCMSTSTVCDSALRVLCVTESSCHLYTISRC